MSISVAPLTLGGVDLLPAHTRRCLFWEVDPTLAQSSSFNDPVFEKEAWLSMVMLEWGSCGQVATVDTKPAGCALYAPPSAVPRAKMFPTSPVSPDAVLLTTLSLEPQFDRNYPGFGSVDDGQGAILADRLVKAAVSDLVRRGVRAIEAFGIREPEENSLHCAPENCMIEADFLEQVGFEVVAPHYLYPRLRLELDHDHGWKEDVERALDQLLAAAALTTSMVGCS